MKNEIQIFKQVKYSVYEGRTKYIGKFTEENVLTLFCHVINSTSYFTAPLILKEDDSLTLFNFGYLMFTAIKDE